MDEQQARRLIETIDQQTESLNELSAHPTTPVSEAKLLFDELKNSLKQAKDLANESIAWTSRGPWALTPFGTVIGVLAALSIKDGTAYALIGLLFAAIGGSVVGWYGTTLTDVQRLSFVKHICALSCGLLLGLVIGLVLRSWGNYLTSESPSSEQTVANEVRTKLLRKISKELDAPGNLTEEQWKRFKPILSPAAETASVQPPPAPRSNPFIVHEAMKQKIDAVKTDLTTVIDAAKKGEMVSTEKLEEVLGRLKEVANELATPPSH